MFAESLVVCVIITEEEGEELREVIFPRDSKSCFLLDTNVADGEDKSREVLILRDK